MYFPPDAESELSEGGEDLRGNAVRASTKALSQADRGWLSSGSMDESSLTEVRRSYTFSL